MIIRYPITSYLTQTFLAQTERSETNYNTYFKTFQFHTEALTALLADDNKFGFIVMDGNGALFGTLQGNTREVLHKFTVDLPKKHGT